MHQIQEDDLENLEVNSYLILLYISSVQKGFYFLHICNYILGVGGEMKQYSVITA